MNHVREPQKVAIVTGASQGIGAGLAAAFVRDGYGIVATSRSIHPSEKPNVLTVQITQRATRQMIVQGSGHVVNITTSLVDHARSASPSALTSLTKGGLAAVTRSLATEYATHGVRVNAVALGVIKTPVYDPASYEGMGDLHPLGRLGEIDDVVDGILYLERATFVTGETLHIDGGQAAGH